MNLNLDTALCIGGPCPKKSLCARWVVYDHLNKAKQRGEIDFNPSVVITAPPYTYNDGCYFYMPTDSRNQDAP